MNNTVLPSALLIEEAKNVTTNTTVHQMMMSDSSDSAAEGVDPGGNNPVLPLCANCKVFAIALYSLLSAVAFVGNALILTVIVRFRQLRTPTNMLIANLAVGDLMISIFCIPLSYWHVIIFEDQRWIFGAFLCKAFNFLQATAVFVSSWTLVAISFDRFMAIMFLMSPSLRFSKRKAVYSILITWLFSVLMALPLFIVNQLERYSPTGNTQVCHERWLQFFSDNFVQTYTSLLFLLQYCLPLAVLLITYTAIGMKMWNSQVPGETTCSGDKRLSVITLGGQTRVISSAGNNKQQQSILHTSNSAALISPSGGTAATAVVIGPDRKESVKKLIPMVLLVSALYAICWLPQNVLMNIWVTYDKDILSHPFVLFIWWGAHTLAMFHSIVNPFIYYWQNKRINVAVNRLLRCLPCLKLLMKKGEGDQPLATSTAVWDDRRGTSTRGRLPPLSSSVRKGSNQPKQNSPLHQQQNPLSRTLSSYE